jgi:hypothetical protein
MLAVATIAQQTTLTYAQALALVGGLSGPSKMPWWSWSISANDCQTGGKLRQIEGSVCGKCYALKGNYNFGNVKTAHARRRAALDDPQFVDAFVTVLKNLHKHTRAERAPGVVENRFRWHDAGDLQGPWHLQKIAEIAQRTPEIEHNLPTKEKGHVKRFIASGGVIPKNLHVRVSSPMVGSAVDPKIKGVGFNTVNYDGPEVFQCPAMKHQGNKCLSCDKCWKSSTNINFPLH